MSSSRQPRVIRTAISPRLATKMRLNIEMQASALDNANVGTTGRSPLQSRFYLLPFLKWYIPMLLWRIMILLVLEHFQATNKRRPSILRIDHRIDIAGLRCLERVGKGLAVLLDHLVAGFERIFGFFERVAKDDTDSALRTHDRNLSRRIGQVDVA